jgi:hypothetical protein
LSLIRGLFRQRSLPEAAIPFYGEPLTSLHHTLRAVEIALDAMVCAATHRKHTLANDQTGEFFAAGGLQTFDD